MLWRETLAEARAQGAAVGYVTAVFLRIFSKHDEIKVNFVFTGRRDFTVREPFNSSSFISDIQILT